MVGNKNFNVKNRSASVVVYKIPEENIRREFAPGESKKISYAELEKLTYQPGGRELMANFLQIDSDEAINSLNIYATPEYWMSEKNIIDLIKTGPLDQWLDALDYAPVGAMDLIKKYSVSLPLTDTRKIEALQKKTGFNVAAAIQHDKESKEPDEVFTKTEKKENTETAHTAPTGRRTTVDYKKSNEEAPTTPVYKVVK